MQLTIIVPTTNLPPTLGDCLRAIERANDGPEQVVVIDPVHTARPPDTNVCGSESSALRR